MFGEPIKYSDINIERETIKPEIAGLIPREVAVQYCLIPFGIRDNKICIAMKEPSDTEAVSYLRLVCMRDILTFRASEVSILSAIESFYEKMKAENAVKDLKKSVIEYTEQRREDDKQTVQSENSPAVKVTNYIINDAIIKRASDIHIEPFEDIVQVRYRCDGVLLNSFSIPLSTYPAVVTRIKIIANMDIAEKRYPQDGKIEYGFLNDKYDLRISSLPTVYGEKFVIRILYRTGLITNLEEIDFPDDEYKLIKKMLGYNHGMILVTGPTGSGKSTTLYSMLNELDSKTKNITTIEDPVEFTMQGINQVNVNPKAKITFAAGLRSILRQNPDVIMVGEIRDEETASIAVRAAITGHLVISTLHTNDAIGAIPRLIEMGVERYLLADCLIGIVAQRLVRKLCGNCSASYSPSELERIKLSISEERKLHYGKGCHKCNRSGYYGRCAICEVLFIDDKIRQYILKEDGIEKIKHQSLNKMRTMVSNCREMVLEGKTTYEELMKLANG